MTKHQRMDKAVLKKGLLITLMTAVILALLGWVVSDTWSLRPYSSDTVAHSSVTGITADGDTVSQTFRAECDLLQAFHLDIAPVGNECAGTVDARLTGGGKDIFSYTYDLSEYAEGNVLHLYLGDVTVPENTDLTLSLTWHDDGTGRLPSLWMGDSIDVGRFMVDASNLDGLTVNGQPVRGRLCMVTKGSNNSTIMQWYWPVSAAAVVLMALYSLLLARRKAKGGKSIFFTMAETYHKYRFLMEQLVARDFNTKYRQSLLGVLWSFLNPLMTMVVQYIVFSTIFRSSVPNFPVYLITGIVMFNFFSEAVNLGLESIVVNGTLITKVYMPKYIYPVSRCVSSLINLVISLVPMLLMMLFTGVPFTKSMLLLPLPVLFVFLFALGMSLILSTMDVFFRDVKFLWSVLVLLWTYATPIFYPETIIPAKFLGIYHMNPMYQFIYFLRTITLEGVSPSPAHYLSCLVCCLVPLLIGIWVFRKKQDEFVFHL